MSEQAVNNSAAHEFYADVLRQSVRSLPHDWEVITYMSSVPSLTLGIKGDHPDVTLHIDVPVLVKAFSNLRKGHHKGVSLIQAHNWLDAWTASDPWVISSEDAFLIVQIGLWKEVLVRPWL